MTSIRRYVAAGLALLAGGLLSSSIAQDSTQSGGDDSVYELSPFTVNSREDQGYRATNSISGTRLNAKIKDVPIPIEVITEKFIDDIGATDLREAVSYSGGIILNSQEDFQQEPGLVGDEPLGGASKAKERTRIKLRGFTTQEALRNGFKREHSSDSVNISRVEVVRGPNALLYGVGNFGGIINYVSKRATYERVFEASLGFGSEGYRRATIEMGDKLGGPWNAAYLVTGAWQQSDHWTEYASHNHWLIAPTFSFRPTERTAFHVDLEFGGESDEGIGKQRIRDRLEGSGAQRRIQPFLPVTGKDPREVRWSGPDTFRENDNFNGLLELNHRLADDLNLNVGYNYSSVDWVERDVHDTKIYNNEGPESLRKPFLAQSHGIGVFPTFLEGAIIGYNWGGNADERTREQVRVDLAWRFELGETEHNLLVGRLDETRVSEAANWRTDLNSSERRFYSSLDDWSGVLWPGQSEIDARLSTRSGDTNRRDNLNWNTGHYLVYHGKFMDERLQTISGLRHDRADSRVDNFDPSTGEFLSSQSPSAGEPASKWSPQVGISFALNDAVTVFAMTSSGLAPNYFEVDGEGRPFAPTEASNREAGVKFDLMEGKISGTLSAFRIKRENALRSIWWAPAPRKGNFDPEKPIAFMARWGPSGGPDKRFGDNATQDNGQRTYYWNEEDKPQELVDILEAAGPAMVDGQPAPEGWTDRDYVLHSIFTSGPRKDEHYWMYSRSSTDPSNFLRYANNPGLDRGAFVPLEDESWGFDAQLIFSPSEQWQAVFTYANVRREITSGATFVEHPHAIGAEPWLGYWVDGTAIWGGGTPDGPEGNFDDPLDSSTFRGEVNKGDSLDDTPEHTVTLWAKRSVLDGPLEGFSGGLGLRWESERQWRSSSSTDGTQLRENDQETPLNAYYPDRYNVDLMMDYRLPLESSQWRLSLNIYNLLDDRSRYGDVYNDPIRYRLAVAHEF